MAGTGEHEDERTGPVGSSDERAAEDTRHAENESAPSLLDDPRRIAQTLLAVVVLVAGIYFLFPRIVGLEDALARLGDGDPVWIALAFAFAVVMFGAYVALFRGVVGERVLHLEWRESYQITMAGLAATRLFSAGGAGGIVLTYWALRKAGMPRRLSASRMIAFLVLLYAVYVISLILFGVLLRTGVLPGPSPAGLTIVPAALAGAVIVGFLLMSLIPGDLERRLWGSREDGRLQRYTRRLATVPATLATGTRTAIAFVREPSRGGLAMLGAVGFWAANIAILWASFEAFDISIPLAVLVQGFFVGMAANLIPGVPGGVGAVDAGMIGTFVLFGFPGEAVFPAILTYRLMAFWIPIPPGILAFVGLRRTVARWEAEGREVEESYTEEGTAHAAPPDSSTSESKVSL